jgi:GDP-L-fucose synthase
LTAEGFTNLLTASRQELDLRDQSAVDAWFAEHQPQYVFLVAGTVGGIGANSSRPADFLYDNLMIHGTVVHASYQNKVDKLLYLGSSCIYPRLAEQPIAEGALLSGPLEPTNEGYALAKIAGIKLCESYRRQYDCDFISAMPTNLYGPGDNFDLEGGHVLPALIRRFHEAKEAGVNEVQIWGTGSACREFLHVDDLADACLFLMDNYSEAGHVNVGTGIDDSIAALARQVRDLVHPEAEITYDTTKPDGTPRKVLEVSKLTELGWTAKTELADGLANTYAWFLQALAEGTARL